MAQGKDSLTMIQSAKLLTLVNDEFAKANLTEPEFAAHATKVLGFEVKTSHVNSRRVALGIPSRKEMNGARKAMTIESLFELVRELEKRVATLEAK